MGEKLTFDHLHYIIYLKLPAFQVSAIGQIDSMIHIILQKLPHSPRNCISSVINFADKTSTTYFSKV